MKLIFVDAQSLAVYYAAAGCRNISSATDVANEYAGEQKTDPFVRVVAAGAK